MQAGDFSQWRTSAVKQLFSDDPHQYWLCQLAGKIGGSGLEPLVVRRVNDVCPFTNRRDSGQPSAIERSSVGLFFIVLSHGGSRGHEVRLGSASPQSSVTNVTTGNFYPLDRY